MKVSKKLFFFLMIGICMISLNVNTASAYDQICFKLLPNPVRAGGGPIFLTLGIMDYGNFHLALSGTDTRYAMPDFIDIVGLVHGNAEIVNGKVEGSLSGTAITSDNITVLNYSYHLRLDMATLSGTATFLIPGSMYSTGWDVSVVSCSGF